MGVRTRKKSRNKSRYRIASKRRRASAKKRINPIIECPAVKSAWDKTKPASTNVANMGLVFDLDRIGSSDSMTSRKALIEARAKRKKASEQKPTTVAQQLEEEVTRESKQGKAGVRLTNMQVEYATRMLDKYGDDYKAMARDPINYFQDTWKQIRVKIKLFTNNPRYFAPYLKKKGMLKPEFLKSQMNTNNT